VFLPQLLLYPSTEDQPKIIQNVNIYIQIYEYFNWKNDFSYIESKKSGSILTSSKEQTTITRKKEVYITSDQ
jgi:hypothetical protein